MRYFALIALLAFGALLGFLVGCDDDNENENTFTVNGTVTTTTGTTVQNATVGFFQNGVLVASTPTNSSGQFSIPNLPSGTYSVVVTRSIDSFVTNDVIGNVTVTSNVSNLPVTVAPVENIVNSGVTQPTSNQSALVVFVRDANGNPINATVAVQGVTTTATGAPAVLQPVPTGTRQVLISANGVNVTQTVTFVGGTVTVIDIGGTSTGQTVTGRVENAFTGTQVVGATVTLIDSNANPIGTSVVTNSQGQYTLPVGNVPTGTYTIRVTGLNLVDAYAGPVPLTSGASLTLPNILTVNVGQEYMGVPIQDPTNGTNFIINFPVARDVNTGETVNVPAVIFVGSSVLNPGNPQFPLADNTLTPVGITTVTAQVTVDSTVVEGVVPTVPIVANKAESVTIFVPIPQATPL